MDFLLAINFLKSPILFGCNEVFRLPFHIYIYYRPYGSSLATHDWPKELLQIYIGLDNLICQVMLSIDHWCTYIIYSIRCTIVTHIYISTLFGYPVNCFCIYMLIRSTGLSLWGIPFWVMKWLEGHSQRVLKDNKENKCDFDDNCES